MKIGLNWLKRKPQIVYVVCPDCQRQTASQATPFTANSAPAYSPSGSSHQVVTEVAERAADAMADVDAARRRMATGDPVRDQMLTDIQAGFVRNVTDVGRRLQRSDEQGEGR